MKIKGLGPALFKKIAVITHRRSNATSKALQQVLELCRELSIEAILPEREIIKNPQLDADKMATVVPDLLDAKADLCLALGGDGTILRAFSRFRGMETPVLGVNFGRIGFLSAIGPADIPAGLKAILEGDHEIISLSLLELTHAGERYLAVNDVVVHKPDAGSVVHISYAVNGIDMDTLRCDGLVIATPAGSTAYNLSAGGPMVSLGLVAFIITAVAPHTLRSRPLVLGPGETLTITNESLEATAAIYADGRQEPGLEPGESVTVTLAPERARLVQATGSEFHRKLRDKFIMPPGHKD
jgi:NAD+ kinase